MKACVVCVYALALFVCVFARTASKAPAVSAHITSLTDKDARTKAATHPAFANAGRQAGLEVWRIKEFEPIPVPGTEYGQFYKGDSYIVLKTNADKKGALSWDIHYWIGTESTQDESGAAAILTVGLDDKFNGAAIQHREPMGYESSQFTGYFPSALRYLDGGHASGFNHVTTNAGAEKRLIQVKGKRNVRIRQVDPVIASMNKGDVFILDVGNDIYVYVGEKARNVEKLKAISVANQIRDQDHHGRGKVDIVDQYSSDVDVQRFFTALGSGNRQLVPDESAGGDDQQFERNEEQAVTLSEVSDSSGSVKVTPLTKPYKQEQLKQQDAYILDTVSGSIYVWLGRQATEREKTEAMSKAQQLLTSKKYPSWVKVVRVPQNTEPAVFKQYFSTWRDIGMSHSRVVRSAHYGVVAGTSREPVRKEYRTPLMFVVFSNDDHRETKFTYYLTHKFSQSVMEEDKAYLIDTNKSLFLWIGRKADNDFHNYFETIFRAYQKERNVRGGLALSVKQGYEPETFTRLFDHWDPEYWQNDGRNPHLRECSNLRCVFFAFHPKLCN